MDRHDWIMIEDLIVDHINDAESVGHDGDATELKNLLDSVRRFGTKGILDAGR